MPNDPSLVQPTPVAVFSYLSLTAAARPENSGVGPGAGALP